MRIFKFGLCDSRKEIGMSNLREFLSANNARSFAWNGAMISILPEPKLALTSEKHVEFVDQLISKLETLTSGSFGRELENHTQDGVRCHVENVESLAFLHDDDEVFGFASSKLFPDHGVFYLHGVAMAENSKWKGGGRALMRTLMNISKLNRIAFTSQNPIMYSLLRKLCERVYPDPKEHHVPASLHELGHELIKGRPGEFDCSTFIATDIYGRCLYDSIPKAKDTMANDWFARSLNIMNGNSRNAFLFIGDRH